jgi:hypothetical protein
MAAWKQSLSAGVCQTYFLVNGQSIQLKLPAGRLAERVAKRGRHDQPRRRIEEEMT